METQNSDAAIDNRTTLPDPPASNPTSETAQIELTNARTLNPSGTHDSVVFRVSIVLDSTWRFVRGAV